MRLITLNCPVCGGETELDYERKNGFCRNCGSKVMLDEEIQKIRIDHYVTLENLIILAERAETSKESYELYLRALELDPNNLKTILGLAKFAPTPEKFNYYFKLYLSFLQNQETEEEKFLEEVAKMQTPFTSSLATAIVKLNPENRKFLDAAVNSLFLNFHKHKEEEEIVVNTIKSWKFFCKTPEDLLIEIFLDLLKKGRITLTHSGLKFFNIVNLITSESHLNKFFQILSGMKEPEKKSYADALFFYVTNLGRSKIKHRFIYSKLRKLFPEDKNYLKTSLLFTETVDVFLKDVSLLIKETPSDTALQSGCLETIFNILLKNTSVKNDLLQTRGISLFKFLYDRDFVVKKDSFPEYYEFLESLLPAEILPQEKEILLKVLPEHFPKPGFFKCFLNIFRRDL